MLTTLDYLAISIRFGGEHVRQTLDCEAFASPNELDIGPVWSGLV